MTFTIRSVTAAAALCLTTSLALAANPMVGGAAMYDTKTIVQNAVNSADHTTLVAAVKAADLVDTLNGPGPFTVFAPTNEAFAKLPAGTVENLLKPENKEMLTKILTCHVVAGDITSAKILDMLKQGNAIKVKTVGGCEYTIMAKGDKIMVKDGMNDVATVTIADVMQSNGVIHVIDTVLLPPKM
ncbi:fasciclin domain-containing protein [Tabrizicola sp. J26]|uniref:fasciclin domain-containing protein n=1 Tax=Alitabrizicola rongguiensis TaxID=2909234 RepID=UPI001F26FF09|nr:fasciclin domain-containing protein [Tabrizicola rongguiensis]MCF1710117.1 fasciclin domain-containing protein [Tabrizicola rongguiensis]